MVLSSTAPTGQALTEDGIQAQPQRALSFTFDDGPDERWTPLVLEQLARCEVTATFFMVGERVRAQPELAHTVLDAGHEIQLHCHRHIRHTEMTEAELLLDTEMVLDALAAIGVHPRLWRAPWGICTDASIRVAARFGLQLVRWSIDTHDWRGDRPARMLAHARDRLLDGGAVLMHDALGSGARRSGCENTLELLPGLAAAALAHGLALAPMRWQAMSAPAIATSAPVIEVGV
ncbi:MAG TPA: polysaccharide deacetylase family protein [Solirubrobacteraceae bacterium]|jgi:peptidoglycan/xylan/chitin deacetylase (PgdA/CDA1 family)